VLIEKTP